MFQSILNYTLLESILYLCFLASINKHKYYKQINNTRKILQKSATEILDVNVTMAIMTASCITFKNIDNEKSGRVGLAKPLGIFPTMAKLYTLLN